MKRLNKSQNFMDYGPRNAPLLEVAPGEAFQLETPSISTILDRFPKSVIIPVTGPVAIKGAHPGTALKVEVLNIDLFAGEGIIPAMPHKGAYGDRIQEPSYKVIHYDNRYCYLTDKVKIPLRPMIGKIGTSPADREVSCSTPGPHGGNMDIPDITTGAFVYFPVFIEGALFAAGDVHAAMGDGESQGSGVETEALLTLRCDVATDIKITHPVVVNNDYIITTGEGKNLEEAYHVALDDMAQLIMDNLHLNFIEATTLVGIAADIKINQIVNPLVGVRVALPKKLLVPHSRFS